jgi:protein SEY1
MSALDYTDCGQFSSFVRHPRPHRSDPLANLQATLTADLHQIWDTLSKPAELQDRKLTDYFDLSFTALPHKILASDKFESDVRRLRGRFKDKSRDDFVFKSTYLKRIPADDVAFYMEGIWVRQPNIPPV